MKKLCYTSLLLFITILCNAQTDYYWSVGKKIWLDTDSSHMIVRFDNEQEAQTFSAKTPQVQILTGKSISLVDVRTESVRQQILCQQV